MREDVWLYRHPRVSSWFQYQCWVRLFVFFLVPPRPLTLPGGPRLDLFSRGLCRPRPRFREPGGLVPCGGAGGGDYFDCERCTTPRRAVAGAARYEQHHPPTHGGRLLCPGLDWRSPLPPPDSCLRVPHRAHSYFFSLSIRPRRPGYAMGRREATCGTRPEKMTTACSQAGSTLASRPPRPPHPYQLLPRAVAPLNPLLPPSKCTPTPPPPTFCPRIQTTLVVLLVTGKE